METKEVIDQLKKLRINAASDVVVEELKKNKEFAQKMGPIRNHNFQQDVNALDIAISLLEKCSRLEVENAAIIAENIALAKLLDSANGALKRAGSKTQFMLHASAHDDNAGPVFKEPVPPEDTHVW